MDQGGGVLELHSQDLKMPHTMIMQDFGMGKYELSVKYYLSRPVCLSVSLFQSQLYCQKPFVQVIHRI